MVTLYLMLFHAYQPKIMQGYRYKATCQSYHFEIFNMRKPTSPWYTYWVYYTVQNNNQLYLLTAQLICHRWLPYPLFDDLEVILLNLKFLSKSITEIATHTSLAQPCYHNSETTQSMAFPCKYVCLIASVECLHSNTKLIVLLVLLTVLSITSYNFYPLFLHYSCAITYHSLKFSLCQ